MMRFEYHSQYKDFLEKKFTYSYIFKYESFLENKVRAKVWCLEQFGQAWGITHFDRRDRSREILEIEITNPNGVWFLSSGTLYFLNQEDALMFKLQF